MELQSFEPPPSQQTLPSPSASLSSKIFGRSHLPFYGKNNTNPSYFLPIFSRPGDGVSHRVADVEGPRERRSPKGQGLLRKEGPPKYAILSQNLVLSRFTRFLKGFHRTFNESHPLS